MMFYLAGSIEYSPDLGKGWRAEITPLLKSLGHEVYDPAEDETKDLTEVEVRDFRSWKRTDLPRFQRTIRKIIAYDLDLIERQCDAVVCYWDSHAGKGAGTQGELGAINLSIAGPAETGMQGRGVLVDLHHHFGDERVAVDYDMLARVMKVDHIQVEMHYVQHHRHFTEQRVHPRHIPLGDQRRPDLRPRVTNHNTTTSRSRQELATETHTQRRHA